MATSAASFDGQSRAQILSALVDESLVRQEDLADEPRFTMLGTIREFAVERLLETSEWREVHDRHADHFLSLARAAEPEPKGPRQLQWLGRLETEAGNLRAAMARFVATDRVESAVEMWWALWLFWWFHGHVEEGGRFMDEILGRSDTLPTLPRAWALSGAGVMAFARGNYARAQDLLERGLALFRSVDFKPGVAGALVIPGQIATFRGEFGRARELLEESLGLYRELGDDWNVAVVLNFVGAIPLHQGDAERAVGFFEEALGIARRVGDRLPIRVSLHNLAFTRQARGDTAGARTLLEEGLRLSAEAGDQASAAYFLEGLAGVEDDPERIGRLFGAADALLEALGAAPVYAYAPDRSQRDRAVAAACERADPPAFAEAWAQGQAMSLRQAVAYALEPATLADVNSSSPRHPQDRRRGS